jgi:Carboxypeptidase regulatory-like domain
MRDKFFFAAMVLAFAAATLSGNVATAASLKGDVRDQGKNPPANGLSGARVQLRFSGGKLTDPVITDTDGQYQIARIAKGEYTLVVTMMGYIPRPHEQTKIKVDGDAKADDVLLMQQYGTTPYYSVVATGIIRKVATAPKDYQREVLAIEWDNLRAIDLPPSSKARLASELNKQDASVKEVLPDIKSYLATNPEDIMKAQLRFSQALAGKADLPGKDSLDDMKLSHEIVADMVLFQVKGSTEPEEKQTVFVEEFLRKWDDTLASKQVLQKLALDKSPRIWRAR